MPAESWIPGYPRFRPAGYNFMCGGGEKGECSDGRWVGGVNKRMRFPQLPIRFGNSLEQLTELRKALYLWLQFYCRTDNFFSHGIGGLSLSQLMYWCIYSSNRNLHLASIECFFFFPFAFVLYDWLKSASYHPTPSLPPWRSGSLKTQPSNYMVDLSGDWSLSWVISSHSIKSSVIWRAHE